MIEFLKKAAIFALLLNLAACGGGDGGTGGGTSTPTNGLPFGESGLTLADAENTPVTVRMVRFETDDATGATVLVLSDETITLGAGSTTSPTDISLNDLTVSYLGETIVVTDAEGNLSNGQVVGVTLNPEGTYSGTGAIFTYAYNTTETFVGAINSEGYYAYGFETDPLTVAAISGTSTYNGAFAGMGTVLDSTGGVVQHQTEVDGGVVFIADFSTDTVSGSIDGQYTVGLDTVVVDLAINSTAIDGNGFSAGVTCGADVTCGTASLVEGTFYGPNGEELTGVVALDLTQSSDGSQFVGGAAYVTDLQ